MTLGARPKTEAQIRNEIHAALKALRTTGESVWWVKMHGHPMQKAGVPDFIVLYQGLMYGIEVKRSGGQTARLQRNTLDCIQEAGGVPLVATSAREVVEAILRSGITLERLGPCTSAS